MHCNPSPLSRINPYKPLSLGLIKDKPWIPANNHFLIQKSNQNRNYSFSSIITKWQHLTTITIHIQYQILWLICWYVWTFVESEWISQYTSIKSENICKMPILASFCPLKENFVEVCEKCTNWRDGGTNWQQRITQAKNTQMDLPVKKRWNRVKTHKWICRFTFKFKFRKR